MDSELTIHDLRVVTDYAQNGRNKHRPAGIADLVKVLAEDTDLLTVNARLPTAKFIESSLLVEFDVVIRMTDLLMAMEAPDGQ